jgi:hypothetical protein
MYLMSAYPVSTPSFIKQTLLNIKSQKTPNTIIVGDFYTQLSQIDISEKN